MAGVVNTNVEALRAIKDSLSRFQTRVQPLKEDITHAFEEIDEQLITNYKRFERQFEERRRKGSEESRTDTFVCDRCGGRIRLKIAGDTSRCREQGCNGSIHRVYTDNTYSSQQRQKDLDELHEMKKMMDSYISRKNELIAIFANFFSTESETVESNKISLDRCITALDQYLSTDINGFDAGKKKR